MREFLRIVALGWAAMSMLAWLALGPNLGWTKTSITTWQKDPVTELEGPVVHKRFIPGVEVLAASLLGAGVLFAGSLLKRKTKNNHPAV